jgi:predicted nuclease with TOPRIM domain
MSYSGCGTTPDLSRLRSDIASLQYSLSDLSEVPTELESLLDEVQELERWRQETVHQLEQVEELERGASKLAAQVSDLGSTLTQLNARVAWLENHIRASGNVALAELDVGDADAKQLLAIHSGRDAAQELLTEANTNPAPVSPRTPPPNTTGGPRAATRTSGPVGVTRADA